MASSWRNFSPHAASDTPSQTGPFRFLSRLTTGGGAMSVRGRPKLMSNCQQGMTDIPVLIHHRLRICGPRPCSSAGCFVRKNKATVAIPGAYLNLNDQHSDKPDSTRREARPWRFGWQLRFMP